ncbi:hypothetical protein HNV11_08145 [Spirosoma taeanense]|uniref:AprE-like beta-barrel domain-containing protein n=1 Tax=Spirosoma taeanense TaxID=2735870 RepID=A0A6M5Y699_9BACT|nr:hypothetical protein [Spirosoma taeanense]QJW89355.1 hypothetical protein HNV11_08145 [Spirosoma taeanense]
MPPPVLPAPPVDEADELMAQMPSWPLRWGISLMFGVVLLILGLAWFVKYPDVIKGKITITTNNPPATVVARSSGPIHLLTTDKTMLKANQPFATIGGVVRYEDVLALRKTLTLFRAVLDNDRARAVSRSPAGWLPEGLELGELQVPYNALLLRWKEWQALAVRGSSNWQRKGIVNEQIAGFEQISARLGRQLELLEQEYALLRRSYETRYKPLQQSGSISIEQLEAKRDELMAKTKAIEIARASIAENENRIIALRSQKAEYDFDQTDRQLAASNELRDAYTGMLNAITTWETAYVLKTPIAGRLNYLNFLHENSVLVAGQEVAGIVPAPGKDGKGESGLAVPGLAGAYVGELFIDPFGSGKVAVGQVVNIALLSFGKKEFGMLRGRVATVADISTTLSAGGQPQTVYKLYVSLPNGLTTTVNKKLPFRYGMEGTAEIITKDIRVLERIFDSVRAALNQ